MDANVRLIFGGASLMTNAYPSLDSIRELLNMLKAEGIGSIDAARSYLNSEELLGQVSASSSFAIDTKALGGINEQPSTKERIMQDAAKSTKLLRTDQLDVYYLHAPDRRVPLEEQLEAMNIIHKAGTFKRLGLSNFLAEEVDEAIRICHEKGYILPSVFQGNYSAVARHAEANLLPTLRRHGISFYAYSPIAGGFLTKSVESLLAGEQVRYDAAGSFLGHLYEGLYNKPGMLEGLRLWEKISTDVGIPKAELAYRWLAFHSSLDAELGDGMVFGARNLEQARQTIAGLKNGPLPSDVAQKIDIVWRTVESVAPLDNFNSDWKKGNE